MRFLVSVVSGVFACESECDRCDYRLVFGSKRQTCGPRGTLRNASRGSLLASRGRLPKEEALSRRAAQREKELKRAKEDYANKVPVRIGSSEADDETKVPFSVWDWAERRACQCCTRKPVVRLCGKCNRMLRGSCCLKETGRHRWLCTECATPSEDSGDQAQLLVAVLNEEVKERVPVIPVPASDGPSELSASMAKRIIGDAKMADSMAWPAEMKTKDWDRCRHSYAISLKRGKPGRE